jgi:hypothetical protein
MSFEVIINSQIQVFANFAAFPATGLVKTIYIDKSDNSAYYWNETSASYEQLGGATAGAVWGAITGNLADQTDLINALNNKVDKVTGKGLSTNDYTTTEKNKLAGIAAGAEVNVNADWNATSGDAQILNKPTIPSVTGLVPYTGATGNVDLGIHALSAKNIIVDHPSGSGDAATITKGGSGEALKVVKTSGSGNAASVTGGVTLLDELHLTTDLADSYIASAATWNAKQAALVSGTNIKTLEGQSLLGSGNIDLTKSDVGLGNVDNTSDLNKPISTATQTALNAKQNALTLTTTGTSGPATLIADTLNIPQYSGGGGASGVHLPLKQGYKYPNQQVSMFANAGAGTTNNNVNATNLRFAPFVPANSYTFFKFDVSVVTGGAAGSTFRVSIYSDNNGIPQNKLFESTNIDGVTTGTKTITTTFTFEAGRTYWIGFFNGGPGTITFSGVNAIGLVPIYQNGIAIYTHLNTFAYTYGTSSPAVIDPIVANFSGSVGFPQVYFWKQ